MKASIHPDLWRDKEQRTFFSKNVIRRYMSSDNVKRREREKENRGFVRIMRTFPEVDDSGAAKWIFASFPWDIGYGSRKR